MTDTRYNVTTWDCELEEFTAQDGLENASQDVEILGVRRVLRELRTIGYECTQFDNSVLVERSR